MNGNRKSQEYFVLNRVIKGSGEDRLTVASPPISVEYRGLSSSVILPPVPDLLQPAAFLKRSDPALNFCVPAQ